MTDVQDRLFVMRDLPYKAFHEKLIPTVEPSRVIGVRTPQLRKFAKAFSKEEGCAAFLSALPHVYYEENNLHAFILEEIRDYGTLLQETERFLPMIDNWATCDMFRPKAFLKNTDRLIEEIKKWLLSDHVYTVRYAIGLLLSYYLDSEFKPEYLAWVAAVQTDAYYIRMMVAWYFATALAKQYAYALPYLTQHKLEARTALKAIQKARESRRITSEQKAYLKELKAEYTV